MPVEYERLLVESMYTAVQDGWWCRADYGTTMATPNAVSTFSWRARPSASARLPLSFRKTDSPSSTRLLNDSTSR